MKFCQKCGNEIMEEAVICTKCGCSTGYSPKTDTDTNGIKTVARDRRTSELKTVAKAFMIIGCVISAFFYLIPLCWTIPMTISYCRKIKNNEPIATSFKVCSLLFVSEVAGILMLCTED